MPLKFSIKTLVIAAAMTLIVAPLITSHAQAGGRKKSNGMMRLGGPEVSSRRQSPGLRLGGLTPSRLLESDIYALPDRLVSGSDHDVRAYFLRRDQNGTGR